MVVVVICEEGASNTDVATTAAESFLTCGDVVMPEDGSNTTLIVVVVGLFVDGFSTGNSFCGDVAVEEDVVAVLGDTRRCAWSTSGGGVHWEVVVVVSSSTCR